MHSTKTQLTLDPTFLHFNACQCSDQGKARQVGLDSSWPGYKHSRSRSRSEQSIAGQKQCLGEAAKGQSLCQAGTSKASGFHRSKLEQAMQGRHSRAAMRLDAAGQGSRSECS